VIYDRKGTLQFAAYLSNHNNVYSEATVVCLLTADRNGDGGRDYVAEEPSADFGAGGHCYGGCSCRRGRHSSRNLIESI